MDKKIQLFVLLDKILPVRTYYHTQTVDIFYNIILSISEETLHNWTCVDTLL